MLDVGSTVQIDVDSAALAQRHPRVLQPVISNAGLEPDGLEEPIGAQHLAFGALDDRDLDLRARVVDRLDLRRGHDLDPQLTVTASQLSRHVHVLYGDEVVEVLDDGDLNAIAAHDVGELHADRPASRLGIKVPALLAADVEGDPPLELMKAVAGTSTIPPGRPTGRLRRLGAIGASIHQIPPPPDPDLPVRNRPIQPFDFAALRQVSPSIPLLARAEELVAARVPDSIAGFVHGDLWQGNILWDGDTLTSVLDWDCAGSGPAGIDLGSLRCDAAICFGLRAADDVLDGWQHQAGRPSTSRTGTSWPP